MKKPQKILALTLMVLSLSTGCNLRMATSPNRSNASNASPISSSNAANVSNATNASNSSNSSQGSLVATTSPVSTLADGQTAKDLLERSAKIMSEVDNYNYSAETTYNFGGKDVQSKTTSSIYPKLGDAKVTNETGKEKSVTYLKDQTMFFKEPGKEQWLKMKMPPLEEKALTINPEVNTFMNVVAKDGLILVQSKRPLSAKEFYMLTGSEEKEKKVLDDLKANDATMETMVTYLLDPTYRYSEIYFEQVTSQAGKVTYHSLHEVYSDYNELEPLAVPEEVVVDAINAQDRNDLPTDDPASTSPSSSSSEPPQDEVEEDASEESNEESSKETDQDKDKKTKP